MKSKLFYLFLDVNYAIASMAVIFILLETFGLIIGGTMIMFYILSSFSLYHKIKEYYKNLEAIASISTQLLQNIKEINDNYLMKN